MAYTTIAQVRLITGLSTSEISDKDITSLISLASAEISSKVCVRVIRERIEYLDQTRENNVDELNKTYYVSNWKGHYLGDYDLDGDVSISDVIVNVVDGDGIETTATISTISASQGKFILSTAYDSNYELYVTYSWTSFDLVTPDPLIGLAASYLVSSYTFLQIDTGLDAMVQFGNVKINENASQSYNIFYKRYLEILTQLNRLSASKGQWKESYVKI